MATFISFLPSRFFCTFFLSFIRRPLSMAPFPSFLLSRFVSTFFLYFFRRPLSMASFSSFLLSRFVSTFFFFISFVDLCLWLPFLRSFCHVLFPRFFLYFFRRPLSMATFLSFLPSRFFFPRFFFLSFVDLCLWLPFLRFFCYVLFPRFFFISFFDLCLWLPFIRSFCHVLFPLLSLFLSFVFHSSLTPRFLCFYLYFITYSLCLPFPCLYPSVFLPFSCLSIVHFLLFLFVPKYFPFNALLSISHFLSSLLYVSHFLHFICFLSLSPQIFIPVFLEGSSFL